MRECEYRAVKCELCIWQDYYEIGRRPSYPPRCPQCGSGCEHEFIFGKFTRDQRARLGRDLGVRYALGDPTVAYKSYRDRIVRRRNYPAAQNI